MGSNDPRDDVRTAVVVVAGGCTGLVDGWTAGVDGRTAGVGAFVALVVACTAGEDRCTAGVDCWTAGVGVFPAGVDGWAPVVAAGPAGVGARVGVGAGPEGRREGAVDGRCSEGVVWSSVEEESVLVEVDDECVEEPE